MDTSQYFLIPIVDRVMYPYVRSQIRLSASDYTSLDDFIKDSGASQVVVSSMIDRKLQQVGVLCKLLSRDGSAATIHIEGVGRVSLETTNSSDRFGSMIQVVKLVPDQHQPGDATVLPDITTRVNEYIRVSSGKPTSTVKFPTPASTAAISNVVTVALLSSGAISVLEAQGLLEESSVSARLSQLKILLNRAIETAKIKAEVNETIARKHTVEMRRHLIKRQISELQVQLKNLAGNDDGDNSSESLDDVYKLKKKFEAIVPNLPEEVDRIIAKEFKRLESIQSHHPEYPGIISYLETVSMLPWPSTASEQREIDLVRAEQELEMNHCGLKKVKNRILEFLAVEKLRNGRHGTAGAVLCLHGNPGVGKTSIAESIARSMDRKFIRISLSGVRDESELRGHRKTYIGAMAGMVIQSVIRAGTADPVILLDEIDKVSSIGNPAGRAGSGGAGSVLLELLDPEQNSAFRDAFLNFGFDLSNCFFICTCNSLEAVSRPLLDRLDVVTVEGYTDVEKIEICKKHVISKQLESAGLLNKLKLAMSDEVVQLIISGYTHESGVRALSRRIGDLCRHFALKLATSTLRDDEIFLSTDQVKAILGPAIPDGPIIPADRLPLGVSLGLAVSSAGGDILFIESVITGKASVALKGSVTVTGQLGDVMKESVQTALSLLMARSLNRNNSSHELSVYRKIDPSTVRCSDVHVHFPTGGVQKDGPSAGVSTSIALASLFSGIPARCDLASTGEITLRGDVLPIGGVKQKLIAAHRAGIKTVLVPIANKPALEEVPEDILRCLNVVCVRNIDEVMRIAFPNSQDHETIVVNKSSSL